MNYFSIQLQPREVTVYILNFLEDKNLKSCRFINKQFREIIDSPDLYQKEKEFYQFRSSRLAYKNFKYDYKYDPCIKRKRKLMPIDELEKQKSLDKARKKELKNDYDNKRKEYENYQTIKYREKVKQAYQAIMNLVGGIEKFDALPVLDLGARIGYFYMNPYEIEAPIMRAVDSQKNPYLIFRGCHKKFRKFECQYIFRIYTQAPHWAIWGSSMIIPEGSEVMAKENYQKIKTFIDNKGNEEYKLMN